MDTCSAQFKVGKMPGFLLFFAVSLVMSCSQNEAVSTAPSATLPASLLMPQAPSEELTEDWLEEIPARALLLTEKAFIRVAKRVTPAVVNISTVHFVRHPEQPEGEAQGIFKDFFNDIFKNTPRRPLKQRSLGSGFIISKSGFILTNHHVISKADQITIRLLDRREFIGEIVAKDEARDLAVIKIPAQDDLPVVTLGDSSQIEVGEWAIAIGNPFGLDRTVTVGVISATGRNHLGLPDEGEFLQTDASINIGNSGGPLLNVAGQVIGINTAIVASGQGIGFAIPIDAVKKIMRDWTGERPVERG
ncbi:MAG: trypsin-like peptidase domain-containing protein [Nitrospiria bacterium]